MSQEGIPVWGKRALEEQARGELSDAMNKINVRRLCNHVEHVIGDVVNALIKPPDEATSAYVRCTLDDILQDMVQRRVLHSADRSTSELCSGWLILKGRNPCSVLVFPSGTRAFKKRHSSLRLARVSGKRRWKGTLKLDVTITPTIPASHITITQTIEAPH